jgi:hypothetical protein
MDLMKYLVRARDSRPHDADGYQPGVLYRLTPTGPAYATEAETVAAIIAEANKRFDDAGGRPLPLAANWHMYTYPMSVQLDKIADGYPILPFFSWDRTMSSAELIATGYPKGNADALSAVASSGLPISMQSLQWEYELYTNTAYTSLSDTDTAQTITSGGRISEVSPMGTTTAWATLGSSTGDNACMAYLQAQYATPSRVIVLSNNEAPKLTHGSASTDTRYVATYGARNEAQQSSDLHYRWIDRYSAMFDAFNAELSEPWQEAVTHTGYYALLHPRFATVSAWWLYTPSSPVSGDYDRLMWEPYAWDGSSPEVYDTNWQTHKVPFLMWSPQNESMSFKFAADIAYSINPSHWFEISVWDGDTATGMEYAAGEKASHYSSRGVAYTPEYYKGWVQYCAWICKPRCVREFRKHLWDNSTAINLQGATYGPYWTAILDLVSHVHQEPTLRRFWREGTLVENPAMIGSDTHPFQQPTTAGDASMDGSPWEGYPRNYHLATSIDNSFSAPYPVAFYVAGQNIDYPIYTMAHVIGTAPNREYLIYAHSTGIEGATLEDVVVTIPAFDDVTLPEVPVEGAFYYLAE